MDAKRYEVASNVAELTTKARDILCEMSQIDDGELHSITGFTREELLSWRAPDDCWNSLDIAVAIAVLNNILGYPHGREKTVALRLGKSLGELERILEMLRAT